MNKKCEEHTFSVAHQVNTHTPQPMTNLYAVTWCVPYHTIPYHNVFDPFHIRHADSRCSQSAFGVFLMLGWKIWECCINNGPTNVYDKTKCASPDDCAFQPTTRLSPDCCTYTFFTPPLHFPPDYRSVYPTTELSLDYCTFIQLLGSAPNNERSPKCCACHPRT